MADGRLTADEIEYSGRPRAEGKAWSQAARDAASRVRRSVPPRHIVSHAATQLTVQARNATRAAQAHRLASDMVLGGTAADRRQQSTRHDVAAAAHDRVAKLIDANLKK